MAVSISGDGAVTGVASINTDVSSTELGYLDGVTSAIQPQIAGAGGLVLVDSYSFSSASTVSRDSVFSALYDDYVIAVRMAGTSTTIQEVGLRLRQSGSDLNGSEYTQSIVYNTNSGGPTRIWNSGSTSATISKISSNGVAFTMTVMSPYVAARTSGYNSSIVKGSADWSWDINWQYTQNTQCDGFTLLPPGEQPITGTVRVYGYAK